MKGNIQICKRKNSIAKSEKRLHERIERMVEQESIDLDKESDRLLEEVITKINKYFDEGSPQDLSWEHQRKQLLLKRNHQEMAPYVWQDI